MGNPNIPQGTLNRLKASVFLSSFPELNVTPSFLGKEMIRLAFDGNITTQVQTATGIVQSPEPYQMAQITMHLLKTQALAPAYKSQLEANSLLGDINVYPDVQPGVGLTIYAFSNCAIMNVRELAFDGLDAGYSVTLSGIYYINSNLFN